MLDQGFDTYNPELTVQGDSIAWEPNLTAERLTVSDGATGMEKWRVEGAFTGPVLFGTQPVGAVGATAPSSPLVSGDIINVNLFGIGQSGYQYSGAAVTRVP